VPDRPHLSSHGLGAGGTAGLLRFSGPNGGYLVGFIAAAFVVGLLAERGWDRRIWTQRSRCFVGEVVIFVAGLSWLSRAPSQRRPITRRPAERHQIVFTDYSRAFLADLSLRLPRCEASQLTRQGVRK
jgi:hypothetical protein